jgi:filamentous hemagglutinin family protein
MRLKLKPLAYAVMLTIVSPALVYAAPTAGIPDYANASGSGVGFLESQGSASNPILDVNTTQKNTVINWNGSGFNVGPDGTVNFNSSVGPTSILNYDNSGSLSNIQGAVNNGGNKVFLVNPNGISDSSGAFSGLIANDASNVSLDKTTGKLTILNKGSSILPYGTVTGTTSKEFDLDIGMENGSGLRDGNMIIGGNKANISVEKEASAMVIDADHASFQGNKTIFTSKQGQGDIEFDGLKSDNIQVDKFKNTTIIGDLSAHNVTVNAYGQSSKTNVKDATGSLTALEVNKGSLNVSSDESGGLLIIDGLKHTATNANTVLDVSNGATLQVNNVAVDLTKVGGSTANNFTAGQSGTGGNLIIVGGTVSADNAISIDNKGSNSADLVKIDGVTLDRFQSLRVQDKVDLNDVVATGQAVSNVNLVGTRGSIHNLEVNNSSLNISTTGASDVLIIDGLKQRSTDANTTLSSGNGSLSITNADIAIKKGVSDTDNNVTITKNTGTIAISGSVAADNQITSTGNTNINGTTFGGFKDLNLKDRTTGYDNVTANAATLTSTTHIENTSGTINNLKLNNGVLKIESDITNGVLTFNNLSHYAKAGGMKVNISNDSSVTFNDIDINYNSDKDINTDPALTDSDVVNAGATNSFEAMALGTGGNLTMNRGNIYAEKDIRFQHQAGAGGTLNLSRVYLLSREANIEIVKNTDLTTTKNGTENSVEIGNDQSPDNTSNKGVIVINDPTVKAGVTVTEGTSYTDAEKNDGDKDWWRWESDNRVVVDWDKAILDNIDLKEGDALFDSKALKVDGPTNGAGGDNGGGSGGGTGGGGSTPVDPTPPPTTWPTDPGTGYPIDPSTGWPIDPGTGFPIDPETGLPTDPSTIPPASGNPWEIDPGTGWPINPDTGEPVDPGSIPDGSTPTDPTDPSNPGGGGTTPVDPSNPGSGGTTPTDPTNPGGGGSTPTDPTNPGSGGGTNPTDPSNPGTGGGSGGGSTPIDPGTGLPLDPDTGLPQMPDPSLPTDPGTGLPTQPGGGLPTDPGTGLPTGPETGSPSQPGEPGSGTPTDPETSNPGTTLPPTTPGQPGTELPTDPETGWPLDPETGWPVDPESGIPTDPETIPPGSGGNSGGSGGHGDNGDGSGGNGSDGSGSNGGGPGNNGGGSHENGNSSNGGGSADEGEEAKSGWSIFGWMSDLFNNNDDDDKKKKKKKAQEAARAAKAKYEAEKAKRNSAVSIIKG